MPTIESLIENEQRVRSPQSFGRAQVAAKVWDLFNQCRITRDRQHSLFRDRTLREWIDDNVKRFIQFKKRPAHKKNWQSNLASTTPNEKLIGILSKLATRGIEAKVKSLKDYSFQEMMKERVGNSLLKAAAVKNNDDFQLILEMLEAGEKGTVIGFEDWYHGKRQIREIIDEDSETGEVKFNIKTIKEWNDVRSSLVNLEDFYPGNIYIRPGMVQDMDYCFLRTIMTEDEFNAEFENYTDADLVITQLASQQNESTPFWRQSDDVGQEQIEVLRLFNKRTDEYVILANEVWINPIKNTDKVRPLPWNHKKLPFWAAVAEPLDANFFYGRSYIDKLIAFCDSKDGLLDRILDQATLSISKPVVTDGKAAAALTKGFLQPNNVITADWTNGRPNFEVVPISDVPVSAVNLYQILQQNLEQTSVTAEVLGGTATRQKTATEASIENEGANQLVSLFNTMMENGAKQKYSLRFVNQLQFYTLPSNQNNEDNRFRMVTLKDERLNDGRVGIMQISIVPQANQIRTEEKTKGIAQPIEMIEITPNFLRNIEAEIEIVPGSSIKLTEAQRINKEVLFQRTAMELYGQEFNREWGFNQLMISFQKDPNEARAKQIQPPTGLSALQAESMPSGLPVEARVPALQSI